MGDNPERTRPWLLTDAERATMVEMYRDGLCSPEISRRLKRREPTITKVLRAHAKIDPTFKFPRLDIAPHGGRPREAREVVDKVIAMVTAGASDTDIAAAIGKSTFAVSAMISRLRRRGENVPMRERKPPPPRARSAPRPVARPEPPTNVPPLPERAEQLRMIEEFIAAGRAIRFERRPVGFVAPTASLRRVSTAPEAVEHMTKAGYRVRRKRIGKQYRYLIEDSAGPAPPRWMLPHEFVGEVRDIAQRGAFVAVPVRPEGRAA